MQFRADPSTLCFYEPFNDQLATATRDWLLETGPASWKSSHPAGAPYFQEYVPLLGASAGVRFYSRSMEWEWFIPEGGLRGRLRPEEHRYVESLLQHAADRGLVPVLGFCRSLGRIVPLKQHFAGTHIFLRRNLWSQWMSYLSQRENGNAWFIQTIFETCRRGADQYLDTIGEFYLRRARGRIRRPLELQTAPDNDVQTLFQLADADVFAMFMAVHLYLSVHAEMTADLTVDTTRLGIDPAYRDGMRQEIAERTGVLCSLADATHSQQFAIMDCEAIDWPEIAGHLQSAVRALSDDGAAARREDIAVRLFEETRAELARSERYLRAARDHIKALTEDKAS
jgi:hypothetical protein